MAKEAATRLIREVNGKRLDLPPAVLDDIMNVCREVLGMNNQMADIPWHPADKTMTVWPSLTANRFGGSDGGVSSGRS